MSSLTIDQHSIRSITLVHQPSSTTHPVHINTCCSYTDLLSYHRTRKEANYLMNSILYKGAPLAYTVNNATDGFFGQRAELTYLPSVPMLRKLVKVGAVYGAYVSLVGFLAVVSTATDLRLKKGTLRSKVHNTLELMTIVFLMYKAYTTPVKQLLSKYKDFVPFSTYAIRSKKCGKWMCAQQFEPSSRTFVMVVLAPLDAVDTWCALRLTSLKASQLQIKHTHEYRPHLVEVCVVKSKRVSLSRQMQCWPHLNAAHNWHDMFAFPSPIPGLSTIALSSFNQQQNKSMHQQFVSKSLEGLVLPFHTFSSDREKNTLQQHSYYCALLSTKQLPDSVVENVCVAYHCLRDCVQSTYVHCSELRRNVVEHALYVPLTVSFDDYKDMFVRADSGVWHPPTHSRRAQLQKHPTLKNKQNNRTKKGKTPVQRKTVLWLVFTTNSNRINHKYHNTVQMFQIYDCQLHVAELSNSVTTHSIYHLLNRAHHLHNGMQSFSDQHRCVPMQQWNGRYHMEYTKYLANSRAHEDDENCNADDPASVHTPQPSTTSLVLHRRKRSNRPRPHRSRKRSPSELRQIARYYIGKKARTEVSSSSTFNTSQTM